MNEDDDRLVTVNESLLIMANDWLEAAQIYLAALSDIANGEAEGEDARILREKARTAIKDVGDTITLSQRLLR